MSKKILSVVLTLVMCLSMVASMGVTASAAESYPSLSSSAYCEFTAAKKMTVYVDSSFSAVGTSNPYKVYSSASIAKNDICYIYKITKTYAQVNYPTSSGRKTGYIRTSDLLGGNITPNNSLKATGKVTTYKYKSGSEYGYYESGDELYLLDNGTNYNVIYTAKSGKRAYKLAWYNKSNSTNNNDSYTKKVNAFLSDSRFKNGATWGASKKPLLSDYSCTGCCAYAADFVKYVFGKSSPVSKDVYTTPKEIRAGDVVKVLGSQHWFVVISRNGNSLKVAEGNWVGKVVVSEGVYTVKDNTLYRNGKKFRTFAAGYHFQ